MAPLSQAPLLLVAAMLVMLGLSHSALIQTPLQSVSLPTSSVRGYRPLPGKQRGDGTPLWRLLTRRLDGRFRSRYSPKLTIKTPPPTISSSYGPKVFQGSLSGIYGYPSVDSRPFRPSKTRLLLQRLESGRRPGQDDRQRLRSSLLDTLRKYRELQRDSDHPLLEETNPREGVSVHDQANHKKMYGAFYETVLSEILSDEFNYLLDEASLKESNSGRSNRDHLSKQFDLIYPVLLEYIISRGAFKNQIPGLVPSKLLDHLYSKLAEVKNFVSSRELENINVEPLPGWEDRFGGRVQHNNDLLIYPEQDQINSVYDTDDHVKSGSIRDRNETEAPSNIQQPPKSIDSRHSGDDISDFKDDQENERKLNSLRQPISEETATSSTKSPENSQVLEPSKEPNQKDETTVLKLEDLVKGPYRNVDQPSLNGRGRRSVAEKEEAALHADECHAHNLRSCGQPAMKKLLKGTDMKTKCRVREEFLNCMGDKRFLPCPPPPSAPAGDPKVSRLHPFDDPLLRDLRKSLRKGLTTTCIFGYSRAENASLDI